MPVIVRRLTEADTGEWRDLRLEGLKRHPAAFGADYETEVEKPLSFFADRITGNHVWGAFADGVLVGTVGFNVLPNMKERHKGMLWGMYVRDAALGRGIAQSLIAALLKHAEGVVEVVLLMVGCYNEPARRLYDRMGFGVYGVERHSLKVGGHYYDEELRARYLSQKGA